MDLRYQLLTNSVNKQELRVNVKLCTTISVFDMQVLSLVFDAVRVAVFIVYHFVLFCRPDTLNNLLFLNAKPNSNSTKNCLCTSAGFG